MAPQFVRPLKLVGLAATLWILYLIPWPGPVWVTPAKPAVIAVAFALLSWRLGVGSWLLTIVFSLTFFVHGIADYYVHSSDQGTNLAGAPPGTKESILYLWAVLFSPISLWAPLLLASLSYALVTRLRSNNRWRGQ